MRKTATIFSVMRMLCSCILILFMFEGCSTRRMATARFLVEAKADYPWKLEFCTDIDVFKMHEASGSANMWIALEHPNLGQDGKLVCFIEDLRMNNTGYVEYIKGVKSRNTGWYSVADGRIGFYGWPGKLSNLLRHMWYDSKENGLMSKEISVEFRSNDFPTLDDCERFLKAYDKARPADIAIDENGMRVLVDCCKFRADMVYLAIGPLTVKGQPVPRELLKKYQRGSVKVKVL